MKIFQLSTAGPGRRTQTFPSPCRISRQMLFSKHEPWKGGGGESTKQFHRWRGIDTGCRWRESSLNLRGGGCWWWLCDNCFVIHNNVGEGGCGTLSNKQMWMLTRNPRQRKTCLPPRKRSCCDWSGKLTTPTSIPSVLGRGGGGNHPGRSNTWTDLRFVFPREDVVVVTASTHLCERTFPHFVRVTRGRRFEVK